MNIAILAGIGVNNELGKDNELLWHLPLDMKHFRDITRDHAVIMGRKTFESIGKPLERRINIVLSRESHVINSDSQSSTSEFQKPLYETHKVIFVSSLPDALKCAAEYANSLNKKIFIIGGSQLYDETILNAQEIYLTQISSAHLLNKDHQCDKFFPQIPNIFPIKTISYLSEISGTNVVNFIRMDNLAELSYLKLLSKSLTKSQRFEKYLVRASFSKSLKFDIKSFNYLGKKYYKIPLLTTKKMFSKGLFYELLWFLRGDTNISYLRDNGVHIWDKNAVNSDIGPGYGYQWMKWGGDTNLNQIKNILLLLKTNPTSRRMVLSSWNVADLDKMVLPPCHLLYIFSTINGVLNCQMTMRSTDIFLGLPFNMMTTSLLTIFLAEISGLNVGKIAINMADMHIYEEHIKAAEQQLKCKPFGQPLLTINKKINDLDDVLNLKFEDCEFIATSHPAIKATMLKT